MCSRSPSPRKSTSRRPRASVLEKFKEIKTRVRALAPGGDLEALIHQGAEEMKAVLAQELLAERQDQAASPEAAFSPSGMPGL